MNYITKERHFGSVFLKTCNLVQTVNCQEAVIMSSIICAILASRIHMCSVRRPFLCSVRFTWVLRRANPLPLSTIGGPLRQLRDPEDYVYAVVENTEDTPSPPIDIIMTGNAENIGLEGDVLTVDPWVCRRHLFPAGMAVYRTPDTERKYAAAIARRKDPTRPQQTVAGFTTACHLRRMQVPVLMNRDAAPWTVTRAHVMAALRRAGVRLKSPDLLRMPDGELHSDQVGEGKEFLVEVTVNGLDMVPVRCHVVLYSRDEGLGSMFGKKPNS